MYFYASNILYLKTFFERLSISELYAKKLNDYLHPYILSFSSSGDIVTLSNGYWCLEILLPFSKLMTIIYAHHKAIFPLAITKFKKRRKTEQKIILGGGDDERPKKFFVVYCIEAYSIEPSSVP